MGSNNIFQVRPVLVYDQARLFVSKINHQFNHQFLANIANIKATSLWDEAESELGHVQLDSPTMRVTTFLCSNVPDKAVRYTKHIQEKNGYRMLSNVQYSQEKVF